MKTKIFVFPIVGFLYLFGNQLICQQLFVGDTVPNFVIRNIVNHSNEEIRLTDYKNKLLILDFFGSFCAPCIEHIPYYDSLQKQINDLAILPIAAEGPERVSKILDKKGWTRPFGVNRDSILFEFFPYTIIPHLVWIKNKRVVAITDAGAVTIKNIQEILNGSHFLLPEKNDLIAYNRHKPLLVNNNGGTGESLKLQSLFTGYIPGLPGGYDRPHNGLQSINTPALELYRRIYSDGAPENYFYKFDNRITIILEDSLKAIVENGQPFCYSLFVPYEMPRDQIMQLAKKDLNRFFGLYFGINGTIESQQVNCLELIKINANAKHKVASLKVPSNIEIVKVKDMEKLMEILAFKLQDQSLPVIDGTGYVGKLDLEIPVDIMGLSSVKLWLEGQGFDLNENKSEIKMLVIRNTERNFSVQK